MQIIYRFVETDYKLKKNGKKGYNQLLQKKFQTKNIMLVNFLTSICSFSNDPKFKINTIKFLTSKTSCGKKIKENLKN